MEWHDPSALPAPLTPPVAAPIAPPEPAAPRSTGFGARRTVLTAALSALLLVGGTVAIVSAASPDPGASQAPTTMTPNGGTTTPQTRPNHGSGNGVDCPNMGGSSGGSSGSSGGSSGTQSTPNTAPTPAT